MYKKTKQNKKTILLNDKIKHKFFSYVVQSQFSCSAYSRNADSFKIEIILAYCLQIQIISRIDTKLVLEREKERGKKGGTREGRKEKERKEERLEKRFKHECFERGNFMLRVPAVDLGFKLLLSHYSSWVMGFSLANTHPEC